jgi:hypothetical protein
MNTKFPDSVDVDLLNVDVAVGEPWDPCRCPLALAITRAVQKYLSEPSTEQVAVGSRDVNIHFYEGEKVVCVTYDFPPEAVTFIRMFDRRGASKKQRVKVYGPEPKAFTFTMTRVA